MYYSDFNYLVYDNYECSLIIYLFSTTKSMNFTLNKKKKYGTLMAL